MAQKEVAPDFLPDEAPDLLPDSAPDVIPDEPSAAAVSKLESLGRGGVQGLSFGYGDEGTGLVEAAWEKAKGNPDDFAEIYRKSRDESRAANAAAQKANPWTYGAASVAGSIAPAALTGGSTLGLVAGGAAAGLGVSEADLTKGEVGRAALDTGVGAGLGYAGGKIAEKAPKALSEVGKYISDKFGRGAENAAIRATGATGKQVQKFKPNTGRELLDRGIVKFGSHPDAIATRAQQGMDVATSQIDDALKSATTTVSKKQVLSQLDDKIADLAADPSQAGVMRKLLRIREDVAAKEVADDMKALAAEQTKRGFQRQSNYMKPNTTQASKIAASIYQKEVEGAVGSLDPAALTKFKAGKESYGLLAPVEEIASGRANQLQQHPVGGLNDMAAAVTGFSKGDPTGGVATAVARRILAPRANAAGAKTLDVASKAAKIFSDSVPQTGAKTMGAASQYAARKGVDVLGDALKTDPESLGKYAPLFESARAQGDNAMATTEFILQQKDPEFQELMKLKRKNQ